MLNASKVTEQVVEYFLADPELTDRVITRGEPVNDSAATAARGWLGVYKERVTYEPKSLSQNVGGWRPVMGLAVVVQGHSMTSGEQAEDALEAEVERVLEALLRLRGEPFSYLENIEEIDIEYGSVLDARESRFFQQAIISLTVEFKYDPT